MLCNVSQQSSTLDPRTTAAQPHTFAGDEGDKLAYTLLHAFFGFFGDFGVFGQRRLHDPGDWCKVTYVSIRDGRRG